MDKTEHENANRHLGLNDIFKNIISCNIKNENGGKFKKIFFLNKMI